MLAGRILRLKDLVGRLREMLGYLNENVTGVIDAPSIGTQAPEMEGAMKALASQMHRHVEDLREAACRDGLTGLLNRVEMQKKVERIVGGASDDLQCALFFIDMDGFKAVNDTLGHHIGDRLLQNAADRLRMATQLDAQSDASPPDTAQPLTCIARFGGDEFVCFTAQPGCAQQASRIASRIVKVLSEPFEIGPHTINVSASVGVALRPDNGMDYATLIRSADTAMYCAKGSGRGCYEFYDPVMDIKAREEAEAEQELREALVRGNLELFYQPLYNVHSRRLLGAEALIRWRHPRKGLMLPQQFLHLANRANLDIQIGEWVIQESVKRIAEFERTGSPVQISINISPSHLERGDFIATVKAAIARWKIRPELLQIELTEESALRDPELAADRLRQLADIGVTLAVDDFGTGYSNLASLITLPISKLKIDKSLLKDITIRPDARVLVQTIISMANSLGLHSVAEGVETKAQLELLSAMGCDVVQGFLFSRPVELSAFRKLQKQGDYMDADFGILNTAA
ncbi:putative bifunctional diguanylate cyclase/phosphodiesterase [Novosphingobium decolorationis]|uniref:Bifunctional diguanylate cyclase/phosphodiesterase n=1 Tax=Novosphingobium decolorationis TaxID=2698673 RepID=A0ABX8EAC5_9SPHN|nr:bifunctional diguanylate cyclase/phosphodiesterase [Novosphingobium decolorationis]MED5547032.1 bifunctional diguanylate cyclase/phosphodiesterase [Pseudomonadota bacterium]QVM85738.1 bifunctional diguanylate cyclase/phosphodiesterase [Novosphingobium decolorationis]